MKELFLTKPSMKYASQYMEYKKEFLDINSSMDGCGALRRVNSGEEFVLESQKDLSRKTLTPGRVMATLLLFVRKNDNKILGMIQIRHYFNEYLEKYGGHIGYSIRPSERRKGYAKQMLNQALIVCKELGLKKVLITCEKGNIGSEKTILANGGIYESTVYCETEKIWLMRFWIEI